MRAFLLLLFVAACSSGGGGGTRTERVEETLSFGLVRKDVPTSRAIEIFNPYEEEASFELVEAPGGGFTLPELFFPTVAAPLSRRFLDVTFTPGTEAFVESGIVVRVSAGKQRRLLRIALDATLETPSVQLLTGDLAFGDVLAGERASQTIRIRNSSTVTPVVVNSAAGLPVGFDLSPAGLQIGPGVIADFELEYAPVAPANHDFAITFTHDAEGPPLDFTVTARTTTWIPKMIFEFGSVAVAAAETAWLEVDVPPHAISLHLEVTGPNVVIGLLGFEGPGGQVYENDTATGDLLWFTGDDGVFTATLPSSDRPGLQLVPGGGVYRFRFYLMQGSASSLDVRAIVHNRPNGVVAGGTVDLNVFLADGLGISAAAAPGHTRLQEILDEADRIFGQQGLSIGEVDYYVLGDPAYDQVTSDAEFGDMLELSVIANQERLNLFFVEQALGGGVLGVAARLSGPVLLGTRVSGVMVDFDFGTSADGGYVAAHEAGHFLGLLHTTEQSGAFDLIDDTLECPATGTSAECATEGNDNLMHWRTLNADPLLTDGQGIVILGHPLVGPATAAPQLAARSPLLTRAVRSALPENWCGTRGCCGTPK
ncbi:MAG: hypothetical protein ACYTHK_04900 [Planctomycetota bacterium]|jgi:hypothetical protein